MSDMRRFGAAFVMAAMLAMGAGTVSLEAKKPGGGGGQQAICKYLKSVMEYPNVSPYIYAWAAALYDYYGCE